MQGDPRRIQVAVLGGGCGAIAAAFELTATPQLRAKYAVTVYQQGWRLGGKGASGRNAAFAHRIEEHGLHMWLGFYENAFSLIRRAYDEWDKAPDNPFRTWRDAFTAQTEISLGQHGDTSTWDFWNIPLPPLPGEPGDGEPPSLDDFAKRLIEWLRARHAQSAAVPQGHPLDGLLGEIEHALSLGRHEAAQAHAAKAAGHLADLEPTLGRLLLLIEIGWAVLKGVLEDVLPFGHEGFRRIDGLDFREWLRGHHLSERAANSAPIKALYDLGFAYAGGDSARPRASAGVALYVMLNMVLGSRGAPLYRMNAGMGDTIFAPLYQVLAARGVRFEFFTRVEALHLSTDGNLVQSINLARQVATVGGAAYEPLVPVAYAGGGSLPCWPSAPQWNQIADGAGIREKLAGEGLTLENKWCSQSVGAVQLRLGRDYDQVVLGISVAALPDSCAELIAASAPFAAMVANLATVQTQALQLWLTRDTAALGWGESGSVLTSYADPLSTWADMTHLLSAEPWPPGGPQSIAYFCGPLPDSATTQCLAQPSPPACATAVVAAGSGQWLGAFAPPIWPNATARNGEGFDWQVLYDPGSGRGAGRLVSQYVRANIDPTERYVLSLPGTVQYRLKSGDSGFANLFLAGDWVQTRMNSGCVEAAVEGGMRAAQAISGYPQVIFGSGTEG